MNILTDDLPVSVVIDDKVYALNTDYRTGLTIMEAFEDQGLTDQEKALVMLELLYPEVPRNIGEAQRKALWFLNCGEPAIASDNNQPEERRYSFTQDARYIYTAILPDAWNRPRTDGVSPLVEISVSVFGPAGGLFF